MKTGFRFNILPRFVAVALSLVIVLGALAMPAAQPALAATSCSTTHIVQAGETTGQIAHRYDLKWAEIAKANKLHFPYDLKAGQELCIPGESSTTSTSETKAVITVTVSKGRIFLNTNKFSTASVFNVKVRDATTGIGGWEKLGKLRVEKNTKTSNTYSLPSSLRDVLTVSVCLKNVTTDELLCRSALNVR